MPVVEVTVFIALSHYEVDILISLSHIIVRSNWLIWHIFGILGAYLFLTHIWQWCGK